MTDQNSSRPFQAASTPASSFTVEMREIIHATTPIVVNGRVMLAAGTVIKASGDFHIGEICHISRSGAAPLRAEVIGFEADQAILTPYGALTGVSNKSVVIPSGAGHDVPVGPALLGRVVDALGQPMDHRGAIAYDRFYPAENAPPDPMRRPVISTPLPLKVRALDGFLTCGEGQRMGIFAAAGGGKSTLLSMLVRNAQADVTIVALIGERGREVREFIEHQLGEEGLARSVVVVATSDRPAVEQVKAAYTATAIAEYFRDMGARVLLLMDSVTRFARAQRQIGLAAGEPPTRRGFPPSVFEKLPSLLERSGRTDSGSITALYTVLVEGDDMNEPVADEVRSLLDGHILLSRKLAAKGHYPAVDVLGSVSRVMTSLASKAHLEASAKLRELLAKYDEIELLINIGEYQRGQDPLGDEAIAKRDLINAFLRQSVNEAVSYQDACERLQELAR